MTSLFLLLLAATLGKVFAGAIPCPYAPGNANCVDYDVPVTVSTYGLEILAPKWKNNSDLIDFISRLSTRYSANFSAPVGGPASLNGQYTISGTFCSPKAHSKKSGNVLLATPGLGYDKGYWNSPFQPEKYNFAQYVISQGYSIFFYDRLGTGKSSTLSGFVNQGSIQVNILDQITRSIRVGKYTGTIGVPKKIIYVAHSFGSSVSTATIAAAPEIVDAVILTGLGFSQNSQVVIEALAPRIASVQGRKWKSLDAGYLTWTDIYSNINCFFKEAKYSWDAVQYADSVKAPIAITELLSIQGLTNTTTFKGPVLIQNGEYDFLACNGYCPGVIDETKSHFPGAVSFNGTILSKTGHALNFHNNAIEGYKVITDWLSDQGL